MRCPACSGSLREIKMQLVTLEICSDCKGIWFDKHQLQWAAKQVAIKIDLDPNRIPVLFKKRTVEKPDETEPIRTCPKCLLAMKKINYAYDSNIIIDRCTKCEGIWTDKGELEDIAKFVKHDPRTKKVAETLLAQNPKIKELKETELIEQIKIMMRGRGILPAFVIIGLIIIFADMILCTIKSKIYDNTNNRNDIS